jgi:putative transferase (TIGR04331 family)
MRITFLKEKEVDIWNKRKRQVVYDTSSFNNLIFNNKSRQYWKAIIKNLFEFVKDKSLLGKIRYGIYYLVFRLQTINKGWRKKRNKILDLCKDQDKYVYFFFKYIPVIYLEDYSFFKHAQFCDDQPISSYRLRDTVAIAYANRVGRKKINLMQHGGYYGEIINMPTYDIEYDLSDNYFTWGWKYHEKDVPYKSIRLKRFFERYNQLKVDAHYNGVVFFPPLLRRNFECVKLFLSLYEQLFLKNHNLKLRSYGKKLTYDEDIVEKTQLLIDQSNAVVSREESSEEAMKSSKIVILLYHPSSTFFECLSVDHPCLVYYNGEMELHPIYREKFQFFISNAIVYDSIESLLNFYLHIEDVTDWWSNIISSPEYQQFKQEYCRLS